MSLEITPVNKPSMTEMFHVRLLKSIHTSKPLSATETPYCLLPKHSVPQNITLYGVIRCTYIVHRRVMHDRYKDAADSSTE